MAKKKLNDDPDYHPIEPDKIENALQKNYLDDNVNELYPGLDSTLQCASDLDEGELLGL